MTDRTLYQIIRERGNRYGSLEDTYRKSTGGELVRDPFQSVWSGPRDISLSASIVIPAWNAAATLEKCLSSIERSSFNLRYPHLLEVIVVDDGSTDGTWKILEDSRVQLRLIAIQQRHHSRAHAMNTGISIAQGDIVISCDADMILTFFSIEELLKRHEILDGVLLIGFRYDVDTGNPAISKAALRENLPSLLPKFYGDNRVWYHWDRHPYPGWPENMCRESDHLKKLGKGRRLWMPDGNTWDLPRMVYGALFSMRRDDWETIQGFDERFYGWGWEDTLVGARALALGNRIVPVYAATGLHIAHFGRSPHQWTEAATNSCVYQRILRSPTETASRRFLEGARGRIVRSLSSSPKSFGEDVPSSSYEPLRSEVSVPERFGSYLYHLGRYDDAVVAFSKVEGTELDEAWALFKAGKSLRASRRSVEAITVLSEAAGRLSTQALPLVELALAKAAVGDFPGARASLQQAQEREPRDRLLSYILHCPAYKHFRRGQKYADQGFHQLAIQDFEAVLIQEPKNTAAYNARERSLRQAIRENAKEVDE